MSEEERGRFLHRMEQVREEIDETDDVAEKRRLQAEYKRLWALVKPHLPA